MAPTAGEGAAGSHRPVMRRAAARWAVVTATALAGALAVPSAAGATPAPTAAGHAGTAPGSPTIVSLAATPAQTTSDGGFGGGYLVVRASVQGATSCVFSGTKNIGGLPLTVPCTNGPVQVTVSTAYNTGTSAPVYRIRLDVTSSTKATASRVLAGVVQPLPVISGVTAVASTGDSRCALVTGGAVRCWGSAAAGQLGVGAAPPADTCTADGSPAVPCSMLARWVAGVGGVGFLAGATALAATGAGYCAALRGGGVACWGSNASGQLGSGSATGPQTCGGTACSPVPVVVSGPLARQRVTGLAGLGTGGGACAVTAASQVWCWGRDDAGQAGDGRPPTAACTAGPCAPQPAMVLSGASDRSVQDAAAQDRVVPPPLDAVAEVVSAPGSSTWCARRTWGGVDCWGSGSHGARGSVAPGRTATPVVGTLGAGRLLGVVQLVGSGSSPSTAGFCARLLLGQVACWGDDGLGQLGGGVGSTAALRCGAGARCSAAPVPVRSPGPKPATDYAAGPGPLVLADDLAGGAGGYCAVVTGTVACWGANTDGSLGAGIGSGPQRCGGRSCSPTPLVVRAVVGAQDVEPARAVAGSVATFCMVRAGAATAACWGAGGRGQVGDGASPPASADRPQQVHGLAKAAALRQIASLVPVRGSVCAVLLSGTLACWGAGASGQQGSGEASDRSAPGGVWTDG